MWIFGYGSLIWRPNFEWAARTPARLDGWTRRFYQGSTDHRGIPGHPGRVVTLLESKDESVWGVAYKIAPGDVERVMSQLDVREQGGYERRDVTLFMKRCSCPLDASTYIATPQNSDFLGEADISDIARQVIASHGPSGSNVDYVKKLASSLRKLGIEDEHVFALEAQIGFMQKNHIEDRVAQQAR